RAYDQRRCCQLTTSRANRYPIAIANTQESCRAFVHLDPGIGCLLLEKWRAARLIAGQIMVDDTSGGQNQWIFLVWLLSGRDIFDGMETCFAIGEAKAFFIEARRAGMIFRRARPEHSVLLGDLLIGNAPVITLCPFGAEP